MLAKRSATKALNPRFMQDTTLAWQHDLRGYDAVQLAAALAWQATVQDADHEVVFACFDNTLRRAATAEGLETWPE